ncbi:MAG TPA: kelch repeat-containing protein, partial [Planctomycetota bacterium]|nr:kelch repeat-containing protein [Planctomycetota bacterium]
TAPISSNNLGGVTVTPVSSGVAAFFTVSPLATARVFHTATLLASGQVLVVGGQSGSSVTNTTEVFDPSTGLVSAGPQLGTARMNHAAVLLPDQTVLVIGGQSDGACTQTLASTEIFDPSAGAFTAGPSLASSRSNPAVALYQDATGALKVLIAGGVSMDSGSLASLASAESYDFTSQTISPVAAPMTQEMVGAQTAYLPNGNVVLEGGYTQVAAGAPAVAQSQVFDTTLLTFTAYANVTPRAEGALATSGEIYAIGGCDATLNPLASVEGFDGASWTASTGLATARRGVVAAVTSLGSGAGAILAIGGLGPTAALASCELVGLGSQGVPSLNVARGFATATVLPSGNVVVVGGTDGANALSSIEVFSTGAAVNGVTQTAGTNVPLGLSAGFNGATWLGVTSSSNTSTNTSTSTSSSDPNVQYVLALMNADRVTQGLQPLTLSSSLSAVAQKHATDYPANLANGNGPLYDFLNGSTGGASGENVGSCQIGIQNPYVGTEFGSLLPATFANEQQAILVLNIFMMHRHHDLAHECQEGVQLAAGAAARFDNVMNPSYTQVGIGLLVDSNNILYLVETFQ